MYSLLYWCGPTLNILASLLRREGARCTCQEEMKNSRASCRDSALPRLEPDDKVTSVKGLALSIDRRAISKDWHVFLALSRYRTHKKMLHTATEKHS